MTALRIPLARLALHVGCAAILATAVTLPAAAAPAADPRSAIAAGGAQLTAELSAIRGDLLRAQAERCRGANPAGRALRAACAELAGRLRETRVLEREMRLASEPGGEIDRPAAAVRRERWRGEAVRLRRRAVALEGRFAFLEPAGGGERPRAGRSAAGAPGTITGQVTDAVTSAPLAAVFVEILDQFGNHVLYGFTDGTGHYTSSAVLPAGSYYARTFNDQLYVDELYDDIPCPFSCDETTGTPIAVSSGGTASGIDFALEPGGVIAGTVTRAGAGTPVADVFVQLFDGSGNFAGIGFTDAAGDYTSSNGLPTGSYFALTDNDDGLLNELYDDIPCPFYFSCFPPDGTPIAVTLGMTTSGIDFALSPGGAIAGTMTAVGSGAPIADAYVDVYTSSGSYATSGYTDATGAYQSFAGLPTGTYYARTFNFAGYIEELYDDIPCPFGCSVFGGTPIAVTVGSTTSGIDFALVLGGGISGTVREESTAALIGSALLGIYNGSGTLVVTLFSDSLGEYATFSGLPAGTYYARTLNGHDLGYADELFHEIPCPFGCVPTTGTPIGVVPPATTGGVDFSLPPSPIFADGFESGGTGLWSGIVGSAGCAHSLCSEGGPLTSGCDPCSTAICGVDPFCCAVAWDGACVFEVSSICGLLCF